MKSLRNHLFMVWIVVGAAAALVAPGAFRRWGPFDLLGPWEVILMMQVAMFGMGTQMSIRDLRGVARSPRGVVVGTCSHYVVMPLAGLALAKAFRLPDEIAAGVILVGSCPSGLSSNVMAYIAGANLALSVSITAITTMIAPALTPLLMKLFARRLVHVDAFGMMIEIVKLVIVPISAALLHDYLKGASPRGRRVLRTAAWLGAAWLAFLAAGGWARLTAGLAKPEVELLGLPGFAAGAVLTGLAYHESVRRWARVERLMPLASMAAIVYFVTVTTAAGRDNLLKVGGFLFLVSVIQNAVGYGCGYWIGRGTGLDKNSARSVAFEVGLNNGGMGTGLAAAMGKLATVGLGPALFGTWMNVSGSLLANHWKGRPARGS